MPASCQIGTGQVGLSRSGRSPGGQSAIAGWRPMPTETGASPVIQAQDRANQDSAGVAIRSENRDVMKCDPDRAKYHGLQNKTVENTPEQTEPVFIAGKLRDEDRAVCQSLGGAMFHNSLLEEKFLRARNLNVLTQPVGGHACSRMEAVRIK